MHPGTEFVLGIAEAREVLLVEIDPVAPCVFPNVTENIGQLECHAQVDGIVAGTRVVVAKDLDAYQTD